MIDRIVAFLRSRKTLRRPLSAAHYALWRTTGLSGVTLLRPELRRLAKIVARSTAIAPRETSRRVLIYSYRGWLTHTFPDALIGHALRLRGADVHLFTCGGPLPICDITSHILAPPMPCNVCAPFVTSVANTLGFPLHQTRDYVSSAERAAIEQRVAKLAPSEFDAFEIDGLPVGKLVRPSLQWFLLSGTVRKDEASIEAHRRFLVSGALEALAAGRLLDAVQPGKIYLLNGMFFAERVTIEQARRRSIPFVTHEGGFMPNTHVYMSNDFAPYHDLSAFWERYANRPLTQKENALLDDFLEQRTAGRTDLIQYQPGVVPAAEPLFEQLALDPQKPILALFTNVDWDTAAFAGGAAFESMEEWIRHCVTRAAAMPDVQLVIRIHPAEVRLPYYLAPSEPVAAMLARAFPALPPNVRVIAADSSLSSYALMRISRVGLLYTSTVGMEMSLIGRPAIVAGRAYYAKRGFTFDAGSVAEFDRMLDHAIEIGHLSADQIDLARRYAFLFFFRYHFPFRHLEATWDTVEFKLQTLDELAPGRDPYLDLICDAILHDSPLLYEGEFS